MSTQFKDHPTQVEMEKIGQSVSKLWKNIANIDFHENLIMELLISIKAFICPGLHKRTTILKSIRVVSNPETKGKQMKHKSILNSPYDVYYQSDLICCCFVEFFFQRQFFCYSAITMSLHLILAIHKRKGCVLITIHFFFHSNDAIRKKKKKQKTQYLYELS